MGGEDSSNPATDSTPEPVAEPTSQLTSDPTSEPATEPAAEATTEPATEPSTEPAEKKEDPEPAPPTSAPAMSDVEKIKAAQAERRNRLRRRPAGPAAATAAPPAPGPPAPPATFASDPSSSGAEADSSSAATANGSVGANGAAQPAAPTREQVLDKELAALRLELSSLRRNHLQNIKKLTDDRNMFAAQLAKEQSEQQKPLRGVAATKAASSKKAADLEVQLRAARTRNNDLEAENATLRDEVKQLNFRVQAGKTMDAASDGYEKVVDELVDAKVKCAQLQEEKEALLRLNKDAMASSATLTNLNGELEKSRSEWVVRCAELEKKRADLENKLKAVLPDGSSKDPGVSQDTSYSGSDLQELKL